MFEQQNFKEAKNGRAVIEDVELETLKSLLSFAYTDEIRNEDLTPELLVAADKYMMKALVEKCQDKLRKSLSVDNAANYFLLAYRHNANSLKAFAMKFIVDNFKSVEKTEGFRSIVVSQPEALVEILRFSCKV
jgi:hypothetical protein